MKNKIMFLTAVLSLTILSLSSCSIEGEEICGIWNTTGDYGSMQVEITPWDGKFLGYLLQYENGNETITGSKEEEYIFITDLEFKDNKYQGGKIYLDPSSEMFCNLTLTRLSEDQFKAMYDCEGQSSEEIWYRKGTAIPKNATTTSKAVQAENKTEEVSNRVVDKTEKIEPVPTSKASSNSKTQKTSLAQINGETKSRSNFYIAGIQEVVKYDDFKAMEKVIEALWKNAYDNDFSGKLNKIVDQNSMYMSYSGYDEPKGKMTITLGYQVKDLSGIPTDLKGVKIPANEYLVYPLSGDESDFEGDGWEQLGELMMHRKSESADFEVYTFDNSYNIKKAEMWVAAK